MKFWTRNETLVALILIAFIALTAIVEPSSFSVGTFADLLRNGLVLGIFAIGVLLVLISGGIDVSFTALSAFAMYATTKALMAAGFTDSMALAFVLAGGIGIMLGCVNGFFVATLKLPTLIVTLGTLSVFRGFVLTFIGSQLISNVPSGMKDFSRSMLARGDAFDGSFYRLPTALLVLLVAVVVTWFILYRTTLGRSIFAIGGSKEAATRIGIPVVRTQYFIYAYVGMLSGIAGIVHASMARVANPFDLVGLELSVIAAVVLGGARLSGGTGTISGTLLGVALIVVINNSLITLGIPSTWQNVVIGVLILFGTGIPAWQAKRQERQA
ncbi:ABC transporter permease [Acuticoccus sp. MNP-M23]|uniref:ABC transporter permease n=1 Tax=Acuticoccus sp. MNP-M23 TaxID=3072793 RepID=UPI002814C61A|nr:ABC transporter permease [Acuticoccus sp. MNP-M23]WMS41106.1 ABC transporter permease [Acuticoccus sp. MNP-M23]